MDDELRVRLEAEGMLKRLMHFFVMDPDGTVRETDDLMEAAAYMDREDRRISHAEGETSDGEKVLVSTVFLGMMTPIFDGKSRCFETMVFGGPMDLHRQNCGSLEEAQEQHIHVCNEVSRHGITLVNKDRDGKRFVIMLGNAFDETGHLPGPA